MPYFTSDGDEQWVCQKAGHICTGHSTWIERGSEQAKVLGMFGNICDACLTKATNPTPFADTEPAPLSLYEHCRRESGLTGIALDNYVRRHYSNH